MDEKILKQTISGIAITSKGILAADESEKTAAKRLASINVESTAETRRQYRNLILTAPRMEHYISAVILFEETLHQKADNGAPFPEVLQKKGIVPGIKVDQGLADLNGSGEKFTRGLEGLGERLKDYKESGVKFAKWRAVYAISQTTPSTEAIKRNSEDLTLYANICHQHGFVPIVEPEVLIDGTHSIEQSYEVTEKVLHKLFETLKRDKVRIDLCILKPSMVISGKEALNRADVNEVAEQTVTCLKATVPPELPSINFLSGGQTPVEATAHLNRIHTLGINLPWYVSFSFARALQEPALKAWQGKQENFKAGQEAFLKRARMNSLATLGKYRDDMEQQ